MRELFGRLGSGISGRNHEQNGVARGRIAYSDAELCITIEEDLGGRVDLVVEEVDKNGESYYVCNRFTPQEHLKPKNIFEDKVFFTGDRDFFEKYGIIVNEEGVFLED